MGGGPFGRLPNSTLLQIGDSLPRATLRYNYIVSVPNMYHSLGRGGVQTPKEEIGRERAQAWKEAMHTSGEGAAACALAQQPSTRKRYRNAKVDYDAYGGLSRWDLRQ